MKAPPLATQAAMSVAICCGLALAWMVAASHGGSAADPACRDEASPRPGSMGSEPQG